ncbi:MAG: 6-bladed beta-propeller [Gemmatimonadota bacterium]
MLGIALIVAVPFADLQAQANEIQPTQVDTATECKPCRITLARLATLGDFNDSISIYGFPHVLKMNTKGLFFAIPEPASSLAAYDRSGKLVKTVGRFRMGPGEFQAITQIILDAADTIIAVDQFARRVSIFDPTGKFVRAVPFHVEMTTGSTSTRLLDHSFVIGGNRFTSDRIGFPLHHFRADGTPLRSFGAERPVYDRRNSAAGFRKVTSSGGLVWASWIDRYRIEAWDPASGKLKQAFVSSPSWFPLRNITPDVAWGEIRPFPWLKDVAVDEAGRIWVIAAIARDDWKKSPGAKYESGRLRDYYQSVIEIINPGTARVITRLFVPEYVHGFAAPGVLYSHRETADGDIVYDVWRTTLTTTSR